MSATAPAVRAPPAWPVGRWLAVALAAGLGVAAWPLGQPALGAVACLALGGLLGDWWGRRRLARSVSALLDPDALPGATLSTRPAPLPAAGDLPRLPPELLPVTDGIRLLLSRQQALFDAQAEQLEALRRQAHSDALTGLPNRRHFMAMLDALLEAGTNRVECGLLLLRLRDLQGLNQRVGHAAADRALQAVAEALGTYTQRIGRCFAGRLNGADFALLLPVPGMTHETATALVQALRLPLEGIDGQACLCAGALEIRLAMNATQALALADAALARAEAEGGMAAPPLEDLPPLEATALQGEQTWQRRIARALVQGRVALAAYPVRTPDGRQLHLDCPLRVQLHRQGPMEPASRWLSLAIRSQLCAAVDERAVALALSAIEADGLARCVNVSAQAVDSVEFVAAVARRLETAPEAACRLWLDLPESLALERPMLVREVSRRWRPLGAMVGLEHAGEGLARIPHLIDLGLDCVRIDSRFVNGISRPDADDARRHLQGLVRLVQAVGLQVTAEGVREAEDLEALWALGFDAATGPALTAADDRA